MKRIAFNLFLWTLALGLWTAAPAFGFGELTNEINGTFKAASYDADTHLMSHPFATYFYLMNPGFTNHIYTAETSGDWEGNYTTLEEMRCLPLWNSFAVPGYDWLVANDNGGLTSNTTYSAGLDIALGPPTFYNGTANTNEGIATVGITHFPLGRIPHDSADGDSGAIAGNAACLSLASTWGVPVVDLWHMVWTNGLSTDVVGARNFGFGTGSHPYLTGFLDCDIRALVAMGYPTNVGSCVIDFNSALVRATNSMVISGMSLSGSTLTWTVHFNRMPMAWDVPDGTITNDSRAAFLVDTNLGNLMTWTLQVTNLPVGNYLVSIDGSNVVTLSSAKLAAGWNMFTNYSGALWAQRKEVLGRKRDQTGVDRVTLVSHSAGSVGVLSANDLVNYNSWGNQHYDTEGKRGTNYTASMTTQVSDLQKYDKAIYDAAQQTNHTFSVSLVMPRVAPFHK